MVFRGTGGRATIGLLVEGPSDEATLPVFVRRILNIFDGLVIERRVLKRGDLFDAEKVLVYVKLMYQKRKNLQKVLVCVDCEDNPPREVQQKANRVLAEVRRHAPLPVHYVVILHALEAWTGADENALETCLRIPLRGRLYAITENDRKPKEKLRRLFWRYKRDFHGPTDNPRLARMVSLDVLRKRNQSFVEFEQKVQDP